MHFIHDSPRFIYWRINSLEAIIIYYYYEFAKVSKACTDRQLRDNYFPIRDTNMMGVAKWPCIVEPFQSYSRIYMTM